MSRFATLAKVTDDMPMVLRAAIAMVPKIDRFFGAYLTSVKFVKREKFGSVMATDCASKIFYDPAEMEAGKPFDNAPLLACAIVHEMMHIWRMDGFFLEGRKPHLCNVALDAVINRDMIDAGYLWPGSEEIGPWQSPESHLAGARGFIRSDTQSETADDIYNRIDTLPEDNPGERGNGDIDMDAFKQAVEAAGGSDAFKAGVNKRVAAASAMADKQAEQAEKEGAGDRQSTPAQSERYTGHGTHEALTEQVLSWYGLAPRKVANVLKNVVGSAIRATLTSRSKRGRTMMQPSYLSDILGYVTPGRRPVADIRPAVSFDISGSISKEMLIRFGQEAHQWQGTLSDKGHRTAASFFNTRIAAKGNLSHYSKPDNVPTPHGGTDLRCLVDWLKELDYLPTHLLIWTDCLGDMPSASELPAGLKVIFICPVEYKAEHLQRHYKSYFDAARALGKIVYSA